MVSVEKDCYSLYRTSILVILFQGDATLQETIQPPFLYAVLTSGSTGEPKIVKVPESSILPNITHLR